MEPVAKRTDGFAMAVVVEGSLAIAALLFAWVFHVPLRDHFAPFGAPLVAAIMRGLLATLPMLVVFWWLVNSSRPALRQLREQVEWLVGEMFPAASIAQFAVVAMLAGVGEELLFRGALQTKLGDWTTPVVGLVITSLLFGLAHALSKTYFLFAIAVGGCLGWLAMHYNDLVAPMIAHGLYDFVALVYLSKNMLRRAHEPNASSHSAPPHDSLHDKPTNH